MTTPLFRLATITDINQLVELRLAMQIEVNGPRDASVLKAYRDSVLEYFDRALRQGSYVSAVADVSGKIVSANGLIFYEKPPSLTGAYGRVGYVTNVYTAPEWRGKGLASELMRLVVEHARSVGTDKLHLGATDAGIGVYERVGFKPVRFPALELKI